MLSRLVCRNALHKHDLNEIIKSKIRHSYEAHTYQRNIGFARWFQRIETLFGGNWANGPSVRDKCPCQFSHGRERSISMYGEWWGVKCPHWHVCGSLCMSGTMLRQGQGPRRVPREHAQCFTQYCWSYERWATVPLMEAITALLPYNCTKRSTPHFYGSYMSYVSLVDVRKTWERTATLNGRVHKVWRSLNVPFQIYKPKSAFFLYMYYRGIIHYIKLMWAGLAMLLQAH